MDIISLLESRLGPSTPLNGNEYLFVCPGNSNCGRHLSVNVDKNVYFCVKCGFKSPPITNSALRFKSLKEGTFYGYGNINHLKAFLGLETDDYSTNIIEHSVRNKEDFCLSEVRTVLTDLFENPELIEEDLEYIKKRGFDSNKWSIPIDENPVKCYSTELAFKKLYNKYKISQLKEFKVLDRDGLRMPWIKPNKILIPYTSNNLVLGVRSKTKLKVSKAKYIWNNGSPSSQMVYNSDLLKNNKTILVTEGEFKSALPSLLGFPTVGLPGMSSGHEYFSLICSIYNVEHVIICFDTEDPEKKVVASENLEVAVKNLTEILSAKDIKVSRLILPREDCDLKMDIDTYLLRYGIESFKQCFIKNDICPKEIYKNYKL